MNGKQFFIRVDGKRVEVTEEVYLAYYRSKRKERYYEHDIKTGTPIKDKTGNIIGFTPSKEDSIERLISTGEEFSDGQEPVEDTVIHGLMLDQLRDAMDKLPHDDRFLIEALFFDGMTEREYAAIIGITQKNVNKKKQRILLRLKNILSS